MSFLVNPIGTILGGASKLVANTASGLVTEGDKKIVKAFSKAGVVALGATSVPLLFFLPDMINKSDAVIDNAFDTLKNPQFGDNVAKAVKFANSPILSAIENTLDDKA